MRQGSSQGPARPLYEQTRQTVLDRISSGTYGPGERLPSEAALAAELGIHRLTARRALEELAREGVVVARKGSGTYVAPRRSPLPISVPLSREAFAPSLRRQLTDAGLEVREVYLGQARATSLAALPPELVATGPLVAVTSKLLVGEECWVCSTAWVTRARITDIRRRWREEDGLYGVILDQVGELATLWRSFFAEPAGPELAAELGIRPGSATLVREGLTTDTSRVPFMFVRRHARADRVRYVVDYGEQHD